MASPSDRRKRIRVPVQQKIKHSTYQVLGTPVFEENSAIDLSSNGISFETTQEYKKGALVLLEVEVDQHPLKLLVCVAWIKKSKEEGRFQVGAELIAIDPEHKKQMQGHLASLIQKYSGSRKNISKKSTGVKRTTKKKNLKSREWYKNASKNKPVKKSTSKKMATKKPPKKTAKKSVPKKKKSRR